MNPTNNLLQFEVCANSVESCLAAQEGGANRVELCASIPEGGTTPSYGEIMAAREVLNRTRLHVIIRPRGGDFTYSDLEMKRMLADIDLCRRAGVDGVVFGCLTAGGEIDMEKNAILKHQAGDMSVTFHRAFDRCSKPYEALECLVELGVDRVLTSGQQRTAEKGIRLLYELQKRAGNRLSVMAGCGVNERNIFKLYVETNIQEFHFSARESIPSPCSYMGKGVLMGTREYDEEYIEVTTARRVMHTIAALA